MGQSFVLLIEVILVHEPSHMFKQHVLWMKKSQLSSIKLTTNLCNTIWHGEQLRCKMSLPESAKAFLVQDFAHHIADTFIRNGWWFRTAKRLDLQLKAYFNHIKRLRDDASCRRPVKKQSKWYGIMIPSTRPTPILRRKMLPMRIVLVQDCIQLPKYFHYCSWIRITCGNNVAN